MLKTCVRISSATPYTIEEILDHSIDWINMVFQELEELRIEKVRDGLSAHGLDRNSIQVDYTGEGKPGAEKKAVSPNVLEGMGFGNVGKK